MLDFTDLTGQSLPDNLKRVNMLQVAASCVQACPGADAQRFSGR
jgi:hypothetical protein